MNTARRAQAVQAALKKYRGKPFVWGEVDCLHLARTVLIKIGATGIPLLPNYSTEMQAIRRLRKQGHDTLESLLSDYCIDVPPAFALAGDLGVVRGEGALSAIAVYAGGKWLGWPADHPTFAVVTMKPDQVFRYV
jgi:hypothetical protein